MKALLLLSLVLGSLPALGAAEIVQQRHVELMEVLPQSGAVAASTEGELTAAGVRPSIWAEKPMDSRAI